MLSTDLSDRTVVVTGAGGRLGRVLVRHLAEACGARVAALDLAPPSGLPARARAIGADLGDEAAVAEAFDAVEAALGVPHALVHAVGMWDGAPLAETALADWNRMLRVNLTSTFLCFREAVRRLRAADAPGRLVALASMQGADRGVAEQAAYAASKAGVVRLVEAVTAEHAPAGITAAAVAPSMILFGDEGPDARGVTAADVAALCAYLCGDGGGVHAGSVLRAYGSRLP